MAKKTVYIETSIASFYYEIREEAQFVALRDWTHEWWSKHLIDYQCVSSAAVLSELSSGNHPNQREKIELINRLEFVEVNEEIEAIVDVYTRNYLMPKDGLGDALHLAIASFHKLEYLLTWNCKHLANPNKKGHIKKINDRLGLSTPRLMTPYELMES